MKKNLFSLSVFAIALIASSCSSDIDEGQTPGVNSSGRAIKFETWANKQTKAAMQADDMDNFAVLATDTSAVTQVLIDGAVVSGSNATGWSYAPHAYWPETDTVNFFAYAPAAGTPGITNTGISALEGQNNANTDEPTIEYELPTKLSDQKDLLVSRHFGTYAREGSSGVLLNFRHALSRVKFQAKSESGTNFVVLSIKLKNVKSKATLDLNKVPKDTVSFPYPTDNATIVSPGYQTHWVPDNPTTVVDLEAKLTKDTVPGDGGWHYIVGDDDALYVIPQENTASSLDSATLVDASFTPISEFYIEITYKDDLQTNAEAKTYAVPVPAIVGDAYASSLAFEMERQYTFRFELSGRKLIDFKEVKVSNYDDVDPDELPLSVQFAGSNIYYDAAAKHLTFDDHGVTTNEHFQGVFFKWGSLTGVSPIGNVYSNSTVTYPMGGEAVTVSPAYWTQIPFVETDPVGTIYNSNTKYLTETAHNPSAGVGDICKYLTEMGWAPAGKRWRIPTSSEFGTESEYIREPATGGFTNMAAVSTEGKDSIGSGYRYNGAFLPASGHRNAGGALDFLGTYGWYWMSSPYNGIRGLHICFYDTTVGLTASTNRLYAFSIRCVAY